MHPAVTFDVWNTLLTTQVFHREAAARLAELTSKPRSEVEEALRRAYRRIKGLRAAGRIPASGIVEHCVGLLAAELGCPRELVKRGFARAALSVEPDALAYPDAREALEALRSEGFALALVSNVTFWPGYVTRLLLERTGLGGFFEAQVYADEAAALKPDPSVFEKTLEALKGAGVEAELIAHVGDDFREDFLGAMSAGIRAILVDREGALESGAHLGGRGYVTRDLSEAARLLINLLDSFRAR